MTTCGSVVDFIDVIEIAERIDRHNVRERATMPFDTERIVEALISIVNTAGLPGSHAIGVKECQGSGYTVHLGSG